MEVLGMNNMNISQNQLLFDNKFVREPVDELCKELNNNSSKRIILTGGRGTGKTLSLYNNENRGIGSENQCIYTSFDSCYINRVSQDEYINETFFNHYYELVLSFKLLNYIKKYYGLTYDNNFKDIEALLNNIRVNTDYYINNVHFINIPLDRYLEPTEISKDIIDKLRSSLNINYLTLGIDRFDWTNGNSSLSQNILSKYFEMFDKVIITSDDERMLNKNNRKLYLDKGYTFVDANYGNDINVVKKILQRRIEEYNKQIVQGQINFPINNIDDEVCEILINKTNNISLMIDSLYEVIRMWNWKDKIIDINKEFDLASDEQLKVFKRLKKMSRSKKIHL